MTITLATTVQSSLASTGEFNLNAQALSDFISASVAEFSLGTDSYVDLRRIDAELATFDDLLMYMRKISKEIADDQDAAKENGTLRTYKQLVLAIHAIHGATVVRNTILAGTLSTMVDGIVADANGHEPGDLSSGASIMWRAVFGRNTGRIKRVIAMMITLARN